MQTYRSSDAALYDGRRDIKGIAPQKEPPIKSCNYILVSKYETEYYHTVFAFPIY